MEKFCVTLTQTVLKTMVQNMGRWPHEFSQLPYSVIVIPDPMIYSCIYPARKEWLRN